MLVEYWAVIMRNVDGYIVTVPDLPSVHVTHRHEVEALRAVARLAASKVDELVRSAQPVPPPRAASELRQRMPEWGRALVPVDVPDHEARS
jgi:hypothetical protein